MNKAELAAIVSRLPDDAHAIIIKDRRGRELFYSSDEPPPSDARIVGDPAGLYSSRFRVGIAAG